MGRPARCYLALFAVIVILLMSTAAITLSTHREGYGWGLSSPDAQIKGWENVFPQNGRYARIELTIYGNDTMDVYFFKYREADGEYWRGDLVASNVSHHVIDAMLEPDAVCYDIILLENQVSSPHTGVYVSVDQAPVPIWLAEGLESLFVPMVFTSIFLGSAALFAYLGSRKRGDHGTVWSRWLGPLWRASVLTAMLVLVYWAVLWLSTYFFVLY